MTVSTLRTSGGDYSSFEGWEAGCPANLVSSTDTWELTIYNDAEWVVNTAAADGDSIKWGGGETTANATYNVQIRPLAGHGWLDSVSAGDNILGYDQSNGVAISLEGFGGTDHGIVLREDYTEVSGVQVYIDDGNPNRYGFEVRNDGDVRDCLFFADTTFSYTSATYGQDCVYANCICMITVDEAGMYGSDGCYYVYCTSLMASDVSSPGQSPFGCAGSTSNPYFYNCAAFGGTSAVDRNGSSGPAGASHNATNHSSFDAASSNDQTSLTYGDNVTVTTVTGFNAKLPSGSDLEGNGTTRSEANGVDIFGTTRDGSTPDIGAIEFVAAGGTAYEDTVTASVDADASAVALMDAVDSLAQAAQVDASASAVHAMVDAVSQAASVDASATGAIGAPESVSSAVDVDASATHDYIANAAATQDADADATATHAYDARPSATVDVDVNATASSQADLVESVTQACGVGASASAEGGTAGEEDETRYAGMIVNTGRMLTR